MYLRAAGLKQFVGLGLGFTDVNYGKQAVEVQYDFLKKTKGIMGMPLFLRWGTVMKLNNKCTYSANMCTCEKICWKNKLEVPVADNLKVTVSDQMNLLAIYKDMSKVDYKFGFAVEFKC